MKKILLSIIGLVIVFQLFSQIRYKEGCFSELQKDSAVVYSSSLRLNSPYLDESSTSDTSLLMDIYSPKGDTLKNRPAIIFVHGGAFVSGNRHHDDMVSFCQAFTMTGYITATIDYRLGMNIDDSKSAVRAVYRGIQDGRAAVRFLRANASTYGINPDKIFMVGSSAGGFIALQSVYMNEQSEKPTEAESYSYDMVTAEPPYLQTVIAPDLGNYDTGENLDQNGTPDAIISLWGAVQNTDLIKASDLVPTMLVHGKSDTIVPFEIGSPFNYPSFPETYGSDEINNQLVSLGFTNKDCYFVDNQGHEFYGVTNGMFNDGVFFNAYGDTIFKKSLNFFYNQLIKPDANHIVYVKPDGTGDGSSWGNAVSDLQGAIDAMGVEQVWVTKGTYYASAYLPGETDARMKSFQMKEGVHVYGNFNGTETSIDERDHLLIDEKELGNSVLTTNSNSYHIVVFDTTGYSVETILDGFEIKGGNADNISLPPHNFGGGVVLSPQSIVQNCYITDNNAEIGAGAVLYKGGLIDSCYFISNTASHEGGGIALLYDGTVKNSKISSNETSGRGAGVYMEGFSGTIKNCEITTNTSDDYGAGVYFRDVSSATIQGSYVADNTAGKSGGGIYAYNSSINIYSSTVVNNTATTGYGGGINSYSNASSTIVNSVFIGNTASTGDNIYKCSSGCTTSVSYSGIEGGYEGENNVNISSDDFASSFYKDLYDGVDNVNPPSKCLNAGNNSIVSESDFDIKGNSRVSFGIVDIGAFERTSCKAYQLTSTVPTGGGTVSPEDTSIYLNNSLTYTIKPNTNGILDVVLFNGLDVTDQLVIDANNYIFTIDTLKADGELNVTFNVLPNVDITTSASTGGSISPTNANIEYGGSQIFTLTFNEGYEFDEATFSGSGNVTDNQDGTITLSNVTSDGELSITFVIKQYEIT
ncbi:MAG: hypothetical protein A2X14_12865, partial [Bacteroidetes bacterium GWD2_33_33]